LSGAARPAAPIGVFDSGVGGLTVLRELRRELPFEDFIYLGDTARLPYGTKSAQSVARYAVQAGEALHELGIKALVVACNTASAVGLPAVRAQLEGLLVVGVLEPGARAACAASRGGAIALIATEGTVRGGAYTRAITAQHATARVAAIACPLFVTLAEEGLCDGPIADAVAQHYLSPLFSGAAAADTLLLGCTHFPPLAPSFRKIVGPQVAIVDSAATTAQALRLALAAAQLLRRDERSASGSVRFLATDGIERFARVGSRFLGRQIDPGEVELVDL
jgi:glutamate racemase